jgi:hypothetical protein
MKNALRYIFILYGLSSANLSQAQKAYDLIKYQASIYGNKTTLQLADGYLLASKVTIHSRFGDQIFLPSADGPDTQGTLRFDAVKSAGRYKSNAGSWLTLKGLNKSTYPTQIKAIYWNGKVQKIIIFNH